VKTKQLAGAAERFAAPFFLHWGERGRRPANDAEL